LWNALAAAASIASPPLPTPRTRLRLSTSSRARAVEAIAPQTSPTRARAATATSTRAPKRSIPVSGERVPLYHPRRDAWRDHFAWSDDFSEILGLTSTGCATVACLDLNRVEVVNLRRLLKLAAQHPPKETLPEG
jgi:hypothetical protein